MITQENIQKRADEIYPQTDDLKVIRNRAYVRGFSDAIKSISSELTWKTFEEEEPRFFEDILVITVNSNNKTKTLLTRFTASRILLGIPRTVKVLYWTYINKPDGLQEM